MTWIEISRNDLNALNLINKIVVDKRIYIADPS